MISFVLGHDHIPAPRWTPPTGREGFFFRARCPHHIRIRSRRLNSSEQPDSGFPARTGTQQRGPALGRSRIPFYRKDDHERPSPGHQSWTL